MCFIKNKVGFLIIVLPRPLRVFRFIFFSGSPQIRASAFEGESVSVTDLLADSLALTGSATLDGLQGNVGCGQCVLCELPVPDEVGT